MQLNVSKYRISTGDKGIYETVQKMIELVGQGLTVLSADGGLMFEDFGAQNFSIDEMFYFVRDRIRYQSDREGWEVLARPDRILQLGFGDCDDKSILLATFIRATYPTLPLAFAIGACRSKSNNYSHVWLRVKQDGKWIPLDATIQTATVGFESEKCKRIKTFEF
jgi:hypothetical protein